MELAEFEQLVEDGYLTLPDWVQKKISNVAILVEDEPSQEVRKIEGLGPDETLLGYYQGIPLTERGELYGVGVTMPDTITIYRLPILDAAAESMQLDEDARVTSSNIEEYREMVRKEVADTIWHEFAHHFGMDEHEVRSREEKRDNHDLV